MPGKTVVMVLDSDDPNRGEIKLLSHPDEAARLAEDLIETGVDVERIRVFDAVELALKVAHRPVVSLGTDLDVEFHSSITEAPEEFNSLQSPNDEFDAEFDPDTEPVSSEPLVRNGVRFSSLFKSDDVNGG